MNLNNLINENNLSGTIIFNRRNWEQLKYQDEQFYAVCLFVLESKQYLFETFKSTHKLTKGQNWKFEYTKKLKERIQTKYT